VVLASRRAREIDGGTEPITDAAVADALKRKARTVYMKTVIATLITLVATFFL
jgi:hypothetical protein